MALTFGYASDSEKFTDRRDGKICDTVNLGIIESAIISKPTQKQR